MSPTWRPALTLCAADLSAAVDVYSDWVDACDAVAKDAANKYEERDARGMRLNEYPVSYESRETGAMIGESRKNDADDFWCCVDYGEWRIGWRFCSFCFIFWDTPWSDLVLW